MQCPMCNSYNQYVRDTRSLASLAHLHANGKSHYMDTLLNDINIVRYRYCEDCGETWWTIETIISDDMLPLNKRRGRPKLIDIKST